MKMNQYQWDFKTYYYAAKASMLCMNPYDNNVLSQLAGSKISLSYVYPPITLYLFHIFAMLNFTIAYHAFLFLKVLLFGGLLYFWKKEFLNDLKYNSLFFYIFCLLAFNSTIYIDFMAGNISIYEQFILWLAFFFFKRGKTVLFSALIIFISLFKLTPILFLLLLIFIEDRKKYLYIIGSFAIYFFAMLSSYIIAPSFFISYLANSQTAMQEVGIINPSTLPAIKDMCRLITFISGATIPNVVNYLLYFIIITLILIGSYKSFSKLFNTQNRKIIIFFGCIVYALILPRFKDYSYILLLVPSYYIMMKTSYSKINRILFSVICLPLLAGSLPLMDILSHYFWGYYPLAIAFIIWGLYLYEVSFMECFS
jgi:hypothetical protein